MRPFAEWKDLTWAKHFHVKPANGFDSIAGINWLGRKKLGRKFISEKSKIYSDKVYSDNYIYLGRHSFVYTAFRSSPIGRD